MKTKIIFTLVFIIIVSAGIVFMVFLTKRGSSVNNTATIGSELTPEFQSEQKTEAPATEPEKEIPQYTTVDTDYFTLTLISGWQMTSEENTLPIIVIDSEEEVLNEKAKEIDFRTSLSIKWAELGENSFKAYVEGVKTGLVNTIPIIEITKEEQTSISGKEAYFMEIESIQEDLKFNTFVALVSGKGNSVWAFSFNALEESWPKYKDVFYEIIEGLKMK